jgi:mRNA interferase MazF
MIGRDLAPGDVVMVAFPRHNPRGHEQEGMRPAIVVGVPHGPMRFPLDAEGLQSIQATLRRTLEA